MKKLTCELIKLVKEEDRGASLKMSSDQSKIIFWFVNYKGWINKPLLSLELGLTSWSITYAHCSWAAPIRTKILS